MIRLVAFIFVLLSAPTIFYAQENKKTLADIRQDLNILYVEVLKLRRELSTTQTSSLTSNNEASVLERLDGMEQELRRLTSETENLEFRVNGIVSDGTNRVRDLEYRLVELEGGDISQIDYATTLGGVLENSPDDKFEENSEPELAIGEKADFENAQSALSEGRFEDSLSLFERFLENYPDSPLSASIIIARGNAFEGLGEIKKAARAYLNSFSLYEDSPVAPEALTLLGNALVSLGQTDAGCQTLAQVLMRFPGSDFSLEAEKMMSELQCP
jgi:tol-pal system protein YbgF